MSEPTLDLLSKLHMAIAETNRDTMPVDLPWLLNRAADRIQALEAALAVVIRELEDVCEDQADGKRSNIYKTIQRAQGLLSYSQPWDAQKRFSILGHTQDEMPSILLGSFHKTHSDILSFDAIADDYSLGIRTAVGDFTHTPSGRRYIVAIAPIPPEA